MVIRAALPVPGAWAYGRRGDTVIVVVDESYTDEQVARLVQLATLTLSLDRGDEETSPQ